ncbi:DUF5681 domain-containing protein [Thauera aromatica]|uniref:DUF5681 domain-containing protein n=1 Tax=Thauera aromatica TaxID=59405 RepID=UPI001FFC8921|nr:DUF5681 domain-containing protein [Thauera aromatica]MCK2097121.1 hypothetical protein [Thauera aromatica]
MTNENRKNGTASAYQDPALKRFKPGNPGRPKGSRHKSTLAMLALLEGEAETITRTCIEAAKAGDMTAIRLVLERLLPPAKERPLKLTLPEVQTAEGVAEAQAAILRAVAAGEILPGEAATLTGIVESRRKAIETAELENRITALEQKQ